MPRAGWAREGSRREGEEGGRAGRRRRAGLRAGWRDISKVRRRADAEAEGRAVEERGRGEGRRVVEVEAEVARVGEGDEHDDPRGDEERPVPVPERMR